MTIYVTISVLLILGSIIFFDFEFSQLRGSQSKVSGQIAFAFWFALITAGAMVIPILLESLSHISVIERFLMSCGFYILWFLSARVLYGCAMRVVYHGSVTGDYRCRTAADDVDIIPD